VTRADPLLSFPATTADFGWVCANLKIPAKIDHWLILGSCYAGTALFPGPQSTVPPLPVGSACVHMFVGAGPGREAGKMLQNSAVKSIRPDLNEEDLVGVNMDGNCFVSVVSEAISLAAYRKDSFTIRDVWKQMNQTPGFSDMIRGQVHADMNNEKVMKENIWDEEWWRRWIIRAAGQKVEQDRETEEFFIDRAYVKLPFYGTLPPGLIESTQIKVKEGGAGAPPPTTGADGEKVMNMILQHLLDDAGGSGEQKNNPTKLEGVAAMTEEVEEGDEVHEGAESGEEVEDVQSPGGEESTEEASEDEEVAAASDDQAEDEDVPA
jgi:hypothetical protein